MPELSRFLGIVIAMFFNDHNPPHLHAYGGTRRRPEWMVELAIRDGHVLGGWAPRAEMRLVQNWIRLHPEELMVAWDNAQAGRAPGRIAPLRFR